MAIKKVTKVIEILVCDLCGRRATKSEILSLDDRVFCTKLCKLFYKYPSQAEYVKAREKGLTLKNA